MPTAAFPDLPGAARFRLTLLGRFRLEDGGSLVRLPTRKVESLLAYLALHPQSHPREQLAALLWGERPHAQAMASLRTALSALRKPLGQAALISDRHTVQLNPQLDLWVDVRAFQSRWESEPIAADGHGLPEPADLYAGDLLDEFYDDWIVPLREQLRRLHIARLLDLTQALRARSDYQQAIQTAQRVLDSDAGNEPAHQHLIFCYLAAGDRAEAIAQYERCRAILQREFGVEPLPETTALYHWLRRAETPTPRSAAAALPSNVPFPISSFVGREAALMHLRQALGPARLLTLTGPGGCGKTRLANQLALALLAERAYADGVWWVALAALSHAALTPQAVARALGVTKPPSQGVVQALTDHLRPRHLLLVLDNCEHVLEAAAGLAETLLAACPHLQIVTTSREALGLTGESAVAVPPLTLPAGTDGVAPDALLAAEGPRLFHERARAVRADFAVTEANAASLARLCRALDGLPLAIELAAAQTRSFTVEHIAARLAEESPLALLAGGSPTAPPRHRTLRAAIDWSYDLLPEAERALFRALAVFAGGWTLEAAQAVAGEASSRRHAPVGQRLARLVDKSLVVAEFVSNQARYRYLDTIREYAGDQLRAHGEADNARRRHLAYFARLGETAAAAQYGPRELEALKQLDADVDNLRAALRTGREVPGAAAPALGLASSLLRYWVVRWHWSEGREWLAELLDLAGLAPSRLRANGLNALGYLAWHQREFAGARQAYAEALEVARAVGAEAALEQGHALRGLGLVASAEGRYDEARPLFEAALDLFRQQADATGIGFALVGLGEVARIQQRYDEAAGFYAENLGIRRAQGGTLNMAVCLANSGQVALARGQIQKAREFMVESLSLTTRFGYLRGAAEALAGMAVVEAASASYGRAAKWLAAAQAWLDQLGAMLDPTDQLVFDHYLALTRSQLAAEEFAAAWAEGLAEGGIEAAVAEALDS